MLYPAEKTQKALSLALVLDLFSFHFSNLIRKVVRLYHEKKNNEAEAIIVQLLEYNDDNSETLKIILDLDGKK